MSDKPQSFANHVRVDPLFHFFILPVAFLTALFAIGHFVYSFVHFHLWPTAHYGLLVIVSIAVLMAVVKFRLYALKAQDRIIRLEERLRLSSVLQEPLRSRIGELSPPQLVALRFASDAELPGLVKRALDEKLSNKDIKKAIVNWRADDFRI